jgi:hypothetical protein
VARPPDIGQNRAVFLSVRVDPATKGRINAVRGSRRLSAWVREAVTDKLAKEERG